MLKLMNVRMPKDMIKSFAIECRKRDKNVSEEVRRFVVDQLKEWTSDDHSRWIRLR